MGVDQFVATLRADSGLSQRALAHRAGCTRSTIARIESGQMEPTVTMLSRIAAATGRGLTIAADKPAAPGSLAALAADTPRGGEIPWRQLRNLVDTISQNPQYAMEAIVDPPARTGSPQLDNLLAATAEKIADDASVRRPAWTRAVPPLRAPWHAPGTPRMRTAEAASAPPQFVQRKILLGSTNLWRERG